jgi:hypothetical protein
MYLVVLALQNELPTGVRVHCDLAPAQGLWQQRDSYAALLGNCGTVCYDQRPLAELVNPLVITEAGVLKPIAYDFDSRFDVGSVDGLTSERLQRYKQQGLSEFQARWWRVVRPARPYCPSGLVRPLHSPRRVLHQRSRDKRSTQLCVAGGLNVTDTTSLMVAEG